jgi:HD-GYP domain-containing protein (c-di-GMP phosphodiesterase class II)
MDLFLPATTPGDKPRLYAAANSRPSPADLQRLHDSAVRHLWVHADEIPQLRAQLRHVLASGADLPGRVKLEMIREGAKGQFAAAWKQAETDPLVQTAVFMAEQILQTCFQEDSLQGQLLSLCGHDGDTFAHLTNVSIFGLLLAQGLGLKDQKTLVEIGTAALLHDLGKRAVSTDVLRKAGPLTPRQCEAMSRHPQIGFEELCLRSDVSQGELLMVYQHHERIDGSGYPCRLDGDNIHWMARLCAIVDVFDSLTAQRPYHAPSTPEEALEFLNRGSGQSFDCEMVQCWNAMIHQTICLSS